MGLGGEPPSELLDLRVTAGVGHVTLYWTQSADLNGSAIDDHVVLMDDTPLTPPWTATP